MGDPFEGFEEDPFEGFEADEGADPEEVPAGYLETGEVATVTELPEITMQAGGPITVAEGPARVVEQHTIEKAPSPHAVPAGTRVAEGRPVPSFGGRESVTPASLRRAAARLTADGPLLDRLGEAAITAMPAARAEMGQDVTAPDMRPTAMAVGVGSEVSPLISRGQSEGRREELQALEELTESQAPNAVTAGRAAAYAPLALVPGGQTTAARMGIGAGVGTVMGALRGFGQSEGETVPEITQDVVGQALLEGALGGGAAGAGELVGAGLRGMGRAAQAVRGSAAASRLRASRLNPSPAPRSAYGRSVRRMGGVEGVADALDREGIGGWLPTPQSSARDATELAANASGSFDEVLQQMDAAGAGISVQRYRERLIGLARELESTPLGPYQRAGARLRSELIEPLNTAGETMSWSEAHGMRRQLDELSRFLDPSEQSLAGGAAQARQELSSLMDEATAGVSPELQETWRRANRQWQVSSILGGHARAGESRLMGAIAEGGAHADGNLLQAGAARATAGLSSQFGSGVWSRGLQGLAATMRGMSPAAQGFGRMLESASQAHGAGGAAAAHYLLMRTRPGYREQVELAREAQQEEDQ